MSSKLVAFMGTLPEDIVGIIGHFDSDEATLRKASEMFHALSRDAIPSYLICFTHWKIILDEIEIESRDVRYIGRILDIWTDRLDSSILNHLTHEERDEHNIQVLARFGVPEVRSRWVQYSYIWDD